VILVTPLYAAILALLFVALSIRTIRLRRRLKVAIGAGETSILSRAVRVHGNFIEYTPIALLLMLLMELSLTSGLFVHTLGLLLLTGRMLHAYGVSQVSENYRYRVAGMALTFTVIVTCSVVLLAIYTPLRGILT